MKSSKYLILGFFAGLCSVATLQADDSTIDPGAAMKKLNFLAGHWQGPMGDAQFHADYSSAEAGFVLSHSELIKDGKVVFHEFEKFYQLGDSVFLQPYPGGKPASRFKLTSISNSKAIFESPENDFPTHIEYELRAPNRLCVTLSAPKNAPSKTEFFDLKKKD